MLVRRGGKWQGTIGAPTGCDRLALQAIEIKGLANHGPLQRTGRIGQMAN
jgi:hypothetical protein